MKIAIIILLTTVLVSCKRAPTEDTVRAIVRNEMQNERIREQMEPFIAQEEKTRQEQELLSQQKALQDKWNEVHGIPVKQPESVPAPTPIVRPTIAKPRK